jgi:DUF1680 family protein
VDNGENLHALSIADLKSVRYTVNPAYPFPDLTVKGFRDADFPETYRPYAPAAKATDIRLIPYFAFSNRGETDMLVWLRKANEV